MCVFSYEGIPISKELIMRPLILSVLCLNNGSYVNFARACFNLEDGMEHDAELMLGSNNLKPLFSIRSPEIFINHGTGVSTKVGSVEIIVSLYDISPRSFSNAIYTDGVGFIPDIMYHPTSESGEIKERLRISEDIELTKLCKSTAEFDRHVESICSSFQEMEICKPSEKQLCLNNISSSKQDMPSPPCSALQPVAYQEYNLSKFRRNRVSLTLPVKEWNSATSYATPSVSSSENGCVRVTHIDKDGRNIGSSEKSERDHVTWKKSLGKRRKALNIANDFVTKNKSAMNGCLRKGVSCSCCKYVSSKSQQKMADSKCMRSVVDVIQKESLIVNDICHSSSSDFEKGPVSKSLCMLPVAGERRDSPSFLAPLQCKREFEQKNGDPTDVGAPLFYRG